jgi:hypothetical protein
MGALRRSAMPAARTDEADAVSRASASGSRPRLVSGLASSISRRPLDFRFPQYNTRGTVEQHAKGER